MRWTKKVQTNEKLKILLMKNNSFCHIIDKSSPDTYVYPSGLPWQSPPLHRHCLPSQHLCHRWPHLHHWVHTADTCSQRIPSLHMLHRRWQPGMNYIKVNCWFDWIVLEISYWIKNCSGQANILEYIHTHIILFQYLFIYLSQVTSSSHISLSTSSQVSIPVVVSLYPLKYPISLSLQYLRRQSIFSIKLPFTLNCLLSHSNLFNVISLSFQSIHGAISLANKIKQ